MDKDEKITLISIINFILSMVLGYILITSTENFLISTNYLFTSIFLVMGIMQIIDFVSNKEYQKKNYFSLIIGTLLVWLSLFTYQYYSIFIIILPVIFSLYAFILGIANVINYIEKEKTKNLVIFILSFIIGILLLFRPMTSVYIYLKIVGAFIILLSIYIIIEKLLVKKTVKKKKNTRK